MACCEIGYAGRGAFDGMCVISGAHHRLGGDEQARD
jgi:hypothetical protein